jgi:circadian clock protein KaiC
MKNKKNERSGIQKFSTGIDGLDEMTFGGLPRGRATLLVGGPGAGKTICALQTLVEGAKRDREPGIFVAFEESAPRILENAATFGWNLPALQKKNLFFLNAQPTPDLIQAGACDLEGLLAALSSKAKAMNARRIVFDSLDVMLDLMGDKKSERREAYRLHEWLIRQGLSAVITAKSSERSAGIAFQESLGFMQFMTDCVIMINHRVSDGVSQRSIRVMKYRGSSFAENESALVIGKRGLDVAGSRRLLIQRSRLSASRVSSGIPSLDDMLGGGYFRGASILVTGAPGTAKTSLGGAFVDAACLRGEKALFVSFDSDPSEVVRNLASINVRLARHLKSGLLHVAAARSGNSSAEVHLAWIKDLVREQEARCLVVDPVSALSHQGNELTAHGVVERLIDWLKVRGITFFCSSLLDSKTPEMESTPLQISTVADTWMHLSYLVHAGERNRALTIVKSRGTSHSRQVREMILSREGISLADVYTAGGEVLMGTLRWEKEQALRDERRKSELESQRRDREMEIEELEISNRLRVLENELKVKQAQRMALKNERASHLSGQAEEQKRVRELREGTPASPG